MRRLVFLLVLAALAWPAAGAQAILGEQRVLIMLVTWGPEPWTQAEARTVLDETARFVHSASFGKTSITGQVTPWLHALSRKPACDVRQIAEAAQAAARARGFDPSSYTTQGIVIPQIGCPWGGSYFPPGIWTNGRLDREVLAHELGHTYGVSEEGSAWVCDPRCRAVPYLNPFSVMGHGSSDFSAWEKSRYGWLDRVTEVSRAGSYRIGAVDRASNDPGALRILAAGDEFWAEYRPPSPVWAYLAPEADPGVAFYGGSSGLGAPGRFPGQNLLIFDPVRRGRPSVHAGETFTVPGAFSVRVGSAGPDAADVSFRWIDRARPGKPTVLRPVRRGGRLVIRWRRGIERGSGLAAHEVFVDGLRAGRVAAVRRVGGILLANDDRFTIRVSSGKHRVAVVAVDRAGNRSRAAIRATN
jgi:hypothetical protein